MRTKALWFLLIMTVSLTLTLACGAADEPAAESPGPPSPGVAQTTDAMTPAGSSESAGGAAGAETTGTSSPRTDNSSMPLTANPAAGTQEASANETTATAQEVPMPTEAAKMTKPAAAESPAEPAAPATPVTAQFDDSRTLADIYQEVGLEQFHLAECTDQPHCLLPQSSRIGGGSNPARRIHEIAGNTGRPERQPPLPAHHRRVGLRGQERPRERDHLHLRPARRRKYREGDQHHVKNNFPGGPERLPRPHHGSNPGSPRPLRGTGNKETPASTAPVTFGEGSLKTSLLNAVVKAITDNLTLEAQFFPIMQQTGLAPDNLRDHFSFGYRFGMSEYMRQNWRQPPSDVIPNLAPDGRMRTSSTRNSPSCR